MATILIAEDDIDIINLIKLYLESESNKVLDAKNGEEAYKILRTHKIDLAVIDIMMPKMNGYELLKKIRQEYNMPVIIISAKDQNTDKILGLNLGADDYIPKPFDPLEVVARVNAQLRRFCKYGGDVKNKKIYKVGQLELNTDTMLLHKEGKEIMLTSIEYKILSFLMKSPGRIYTKAQIYENARGDYFESDENTLMVHISNIRNKIEDNPRKPMYIKTVRGLGYKIEKN